MKIYILLLVFLLGFSWNKVEAKVILHSTQYAYYTEGRVKHSMFLLENTETNKPIFALQYHQSYVGAVDELTSVSVSEEKLAIIKKYLTVLVGNQTFEQIPTKKLVAIQALIWNVVAESIGETLEYNFDIAYLEELKQEVSDYKEEEKQVNLKTKVNQEALLSLWSDTKKNYQINIDLANVEIAPEQNMFKIRASKEGEYEIPVFVLEYQEKINYWQENSVEMIELVQKEQKMPKIVLQVIEEKKPIFIETDSGGLVLLEHDYYLPGELVSFDIELKDKYLLEKIHVFDANHQEIELQNNSFVMPDVAVFIVLETKYQEQFHLYLELPDSIEYQLKTNELDLISETNTFLLPQSDLYLKLSNKKQCPELKEEIEKEIYEIPNTYAEKEEYNIKELGLFLIIVSIIIFFCKQSVKNK